MLAAIAWLRFRGANWPALGFPGGRLRDDVALAGRALGLVVFPLLMLAAALNALMQYEHPIVDFLDSNHGLAAAALVVISAVFVAPLTEEFFFRKVLQGWLGKHFADEAGVAVALSAIAFASAHAGQGLAFLPLFPLALVLGLIAERTGSIVPSVLLHAMFNAVSVFLLLAQPGRGPRAGLTRNRRRGLDSTASGRQTDLAQGSQLRDTTSWPGRIRADHCRRHGRAHRAPPNLRHALS